MKKIAYLMIFAVIVTLGCRRKSRKEFWFSSMIENGFRMDLYKAYQGGVYGGDIIEYYLVNAHNNNFFLGKCSDHETISYIVNGDSLQFFKNRYSLIVGEYIPADSLLFSIEEIKSNFPKTGDPLD